VNPGRWRRIADLLQEAGEGESVGQRLAVVAAELLGMDGVSLAVVIAGTIDSVAGSDALATDICRQQFELGEGPALSAIASGVPTLVDHLTADSARARWPLFAAFAQERGVGSVHAFPLRVGQARVGALTAHHRAAGPLTADQYANGLLVCTLATVTLLQQQAGSDGAPNPVTFEANSGEHAAVQVAAGMVSEQLKVSITEAHVRMRAHAFSSTSALNDVARLIIGRKLRIEH
jgi:GAF domain-containing protein